ncbi:hypothetical protein C8Q72DRAFT_263492 [Fomitopsis betulina]|nr:hypothetical protein C8Q72DRAFT_263492 [Fomitopsis betulina]
MWHKKGKTTMFARFRLANKATSGHHVHDGDNTSTSLDVPLLRVSTVDSNLTMTSDGGSMDIAEQTSRTYVTHLDSAWLGHAHHHHHHHHHDAQLDLCESNHISIEFESDTSDSVSEASDENASEDSDQDNTDGNSSTTLAAFFTLPMPLTTNPHSLLGLGLIVYKPHV